MKKYLLAALMGIALIPNLSIRANDHAGQQIRTLKAIEREYINSFLEDNRKAKKEIEEMDESQAFEAIKIAEKAYMRFWAVAMVMDYIDQLHERKDKNKSIISSLVEGLDDLEKLVIDRS